MERVAFLVERTGDRIECLLNPETFVLTRQAGLRPVRTIAGTLTGHADADDPLLATGGGSTELILELLFDVSKQTSARPEASVQALTAPLWDLAENSDDTDGPGKPPMVRFVWGKSWNISAIVASVAERFEQFTPEGLPRRSWVKLRLIRCKAFAPAEESLLAGEPGPGDDVQVLLDTLPEEEAQAHEVTGVPAGEGDSPGHVERIDQLAARYLGDASLWRVLAAFNNLDDPGRITAGTLLRIPSLGSSA